MTEVVGSSSISKKTSDLDSAIWHLSSGNRLSSFVTYDGHSNICVPNIENHSNLTQIENRSLSFDQNIKKHSSSKLVS